MSTNCLLPLELLGTGESGDVAHVHGEPSWVARLADLGIRAGCRLFVLQGGSPCLLRVNGTRLSLRADAGRQILVHPVSPDEPS